MIFNALLRGWLKLTDLRFAPLWVVVAIVGLYFYGKHVEREDAERSAEFDARVTEFQRKLADPSCGEGGTIMTTDAWSDRIFVQACCTIFINYANESDKASQPPVGLRNMPLGRARAPFVELDAGSSDHVLKNGSFGRPSQIRFRSLVGRGVLLAYDFQKDEESCTPR